MPVSCSLVAQVELGQRRFLKQARTPFGFYHQKHSRMQYPPWRRPWKNGASSWRLTAPYLHFEGSSGSQSTLLPKENYITGDWTGLFSVDRYQVYTLQHATSGATCRVRRFPTTFDFTSIPSRWLIGKPLRNHARGKTILIDENMLTKKQRADHIKAGFLPK